jgi:hypothetical protein
MPVIPSTQEAEAEKLQIRGQPRVYRHHVSKKETETNITVSIKKHIILPGFGVLRAACFLIKSTTWPNCFELQYWTSSSQM